MSKPAEFTIFIRVKIPGDDEVGIGCKGCITFAIYSIHPLSVPIFLPESRIGPVLFPICPLHQLSYWIQSIQNPELISALLEYAITYRLGFGVRASIH